MIINCFSIFFKKNKVYKDLIKILGFTPRKKELYDIAFLHRSASKVMSNGFVLNNERLEFLGDAILDAIVADYLFSVYPIQDEGFLSKMRSKIVKRQQLNSLAIQLGIDKLVVVNKYETQNGKYLFGNALEALIGAVYLDRGYKISQKFVINNILKRFIDLHNLEFVETDFKSRVIEWAQKNHQNISFDCHEENENDYHNPLFVAQVTIEGNILGLGRGYSKKEAEQNAAEMAFLYLQNSSEEENLRY